MEERSGDDDDVDEEEVEGGSRAQLETFSTGIGLRSEKGRWRLIVTLRDSQSVSCLNLMEGTCFQWCSGCTYI